MIDVDDDILEILGIEEIQRRFDVTRRQATHLYRELGTADEIEDATREDLLSVTTIGPQTATEMKPRQSTRLQWVEAFSEKGELIPIFVDQNGVQRHASEPDPSD